jgi:signal transduction histidine kinase/CheY-like chemotaxis protein
MNEKKYSVLIVDDDVAELLELTAILMHEYKLFTVREGSIALERANESLPDLILLDIRMTEMDGYEVITALKRNERTRDIPVIFITGLTSAEDEEKGLAMGAVDYIAKPFSPIIVKLRIRNHIEKRNQFQMIKRQMIELETYEYENLIKILNSTPQACHLWNSSMNMLYCNNVALELFKIKQKADLFKDFFAFSPFQQPDGSLSTDKAKECFANALREGSSKFEWMHSTLDGEPIPCMLTLVCVRLQRDDMIIAYIEDLRGHNAMKKEIAQQDNLLYTVSCVAGVLLQSSIEDFETDMYLCMGMMAEAVSADRVYIWKNHTIDEELHCTQVYEWSEGADPQQGSDITIDIAYSSIPEWEKTLSNGMCINSIVKDMTPASQAQLGPQGIVSLFVAPIFQHNIFWGFIGFDDCQVERIFSDNEEMILRSAGLLIASSMLRNEMTSVLQKSAKQLEEALEEAQAANVAKSNFLSNMSHEIRTPMNAIIGMGELMLHEQLNHRQKGYIHDIVVSANALLDIINDILDFSKIESGRMELNPVNYALSTFIDHLSAMFVYIAEKKGLEFKLECGIQLPKTLYGDDLRLRQALTNILGNAVKFTEKGHVCLSIYESSGALVFEVKDTGIGIRKEDIPKLFKAFEQVDKSKNRSVVGTGLGLAISKSFIEMMGGKITLHSEYGQGTVFTITVPIEAGSLDLVEDMAEESEHHAFNAPDASILVVDDNEFNLKVATGLMKLLDITAETASSGYEAIDLVKKNVYDIVFMDHMMPGLDGVETTTIIRKLGGPYSDLPIIALTANAISGAREMFLENGFSDFISKPINTQELTARLRDWLPAEKKEKQVQPEDPQTRLNQMDELLRKATVTFVKDNIDTYERIVASLESGDTKTAHRIAHTLKSSAGFLKRFELQEAARSLEASLGATPPVYTAELLNAVQCELEKTLADLEPLAKEAALDKPDAVQVDGDKLTEILSEIKPLLESGDFSASRFVETLHGIAGMDELAEKIDDYDFEGALQVLNSLI